MSRKKAKNKLKNNNNVKGKNKPKTTTNLAQNSEFNVINSQTNNKKCHRPSLTSTNSEITQLIAQKYQLSEKKQKYGYNVKQKTYWNQSKQRKND